MKKVLMLAALVLGAGCFAENLLVNGDMKGDKGWVIWGKCPKAAADKAKIITYVNEGPNGERVLKFVDETAEANPYLYQQINLPADADKLKYTFTFKAKAAEGMKFSAGVQVYCMTKADGKTVYAPSKSSGSSAVFVGTGDWKEYKHTISRFSPGMNHMAVAIYPFAGTTEESFTGSLLVTDAVLEVAK